jgi:regulator of protease activity HflC (stomatin/prohibitin superfamily)
MLRYFKGQPTDYVICYSGGTVSSSGLGLAFFYLPFRTQIVAVPTQSLEADFVFTELTRDYQDVTLQGQATYRIKHSQLAAGLLNFRIDPKTLAYTSDDPEKLSRRVTNLVQVEARAEVAKRTLAEAVREATAYAADVAGRLRSAPSLAALGVEVQSVDLLSVRPTPEVAKALEAESREALLRKADEAIYARRAAAVDEERTIKEKELASDAALEEQRKALIELQGANAIRDADLSAQARDLTAAAEARAAQQQLAVYQNLDPRSLLAYALHELGSNAGKVGQLTVTTELLAGLLNGRANGPAANGDAR